MKLKILLGNWDIRFNEDNNGGSCFFMQRVISFQPFNDCDDVFIERIVKHELVHALLSELGHSQNQLSNGKHDDSFDSEFICEFISIYNNYINELSNKVIKKIKSIN